MNSGLKYGGVPVEDLSKKELIRAMNTLYTVFDKEIKARDRQLDALNHILQGRSSLEEKPMKKRWGRKK